MHHSVKYVFPLNNLVKSVGPQLFSPQIHPHYVRVYLVLNQSWADTFNRDCPREHLLHLVIACTKLVNRYICFLDDSKGIFAYDLIYHQQIKS